MAIKPWLLPVFVIALVVPGSVGFIVAGPGLGLAIGALAVGVVLVIAATRKPDEPIEVADATDQRRRLLLVAIEPVDQPEAIDSIRISAHAGDADDTEVLVLAPAFNTRLEHWASDVGRSRLDAQRKLVLTIGALAAANIDARGAVGDPDPLQAVEDTLRQFAADEVIVGLPTGDDGGGGAQALVAELRRRLDLPVYPLSSDVQISRVGRPGDTG